MAEKVMNPTSAPVHTYGRMRFLRLEEAKAFQTGQKPRWEATQLIDPSSSQGQADIKKLLDTAVQIAKETYDTVPLGLKKLRAKFIAGAPAIDLNDPKNADDGIVVPFLDGDAEKFAKYTGYKGMFIVPAHNAKLKPGVADRDGKKIEPGHPQYPFDGCYAVLSSSIWGHKTHGAYAKRVGVNLRGVQYAAKGEPFTSDKIDAEEEFTPLAGDATPAATSDGWD